VSWAASGGRDAPHHLVDVLAAPCPGGFLTGLAGNGAAHGGLFLVKDKVWL
jgi:hypothetical protein